MKVHVRPVANHQKQNIDKTHTTSHLQSSEENVRSSLIIFTYLQTLHKCRIQKILVGDPLFFPLDGQTKGGVVLGTTNDDNLGGSSYLCL